MHGATSHLRPRIKLVIAGSGGAAWLVLRCKDTVCGKALWQLAGVPAKSATRASGDLNAMCDNATLACVDGCASVYHKLHGGGGDFCRS